MGGVVFEGAGVPVKGGGPARTAVVFTLPLLGFLHGVHTARTTVVLSPPCVSLQGPMRTVVGFSPPGFVAPQGFRVTINPPWLGQSVGIRQGVRGRRGGWWGAWWCQCGGVGMAWSCSRTWVWPTWGHRRGRRDVGCQREAFHCMGAGGGV